MRYVIVFVAIACFLIWDALQNNGYYFNEGAQSLRSLFRTIGI